MKYIAGFDPGLANFGLAIVDTDMNLHVFRCLKTKKGSERYASVDMFKRGQAIARILIPILEQYKPSLICAEAMSFPRNASNAAKMALTWGIICYYSEINRIPVWISSPQRIKEAVTGSSKASKEDVKAALEERGFDLPKLNKTDYEHPCDALGAIVSSENSELYRMLLDTSG